MAKIDCRIRCCRPHSTTYSTASCTRSQLLWKLSATSFQDSLRGPMRQKQQVRLGGMMLAFRPGKLLNADAAIPALNATPRVDQKHHKTPKGDELEQPRWQGVVARRWFF